MDLTGEQITAATTLTLRKMAAHQTIPRALVDTMTLDLLTDVLADVLVANVRAFVLAQPAGPTVSASSTVIAARFPKWLPKRLRRRWSTKQTVTVTVTPEWVYPEHQIHQLGKAKRSYQVRRDVQ